MTRRCKVRSVLFINEGQDRVLYASGVNHMLLMIYAALLLTIHINLQNLSVELSLNPKTIIHPQPSKLA